MPYPQGAYTDASPAQVRYGSAVMSSQPGARALGDTGWGLPPVLSEWPQPIKHLQRMWSQGLGAQASATSYGWPYEAVTLILKPPPVPAMQMMARGSMAALARPGGGSAGFGYNMRIPPTPVPINYSRTSY